MEEKRSIKPTEAEISVRIFEVYSLLLSGADKPKVVRYCTQKWDVCERTVDNYLRKATEMIESEIEVDRDKVKNKSFRMRMNLYTRALASGDVSTAHEVRKDLDKLLGLYPGERGGNAPMMFVVEFAGKVGSALARTIPDNCPHCKGQLALRESTIKELELLSEQLEPGKV